MLSPQKHDRGELSEENSYSCPEWTLGSFYRGPTRLSLVDTKAKRVINTIELRSTLTEADSFDLPYRILADFYYQVPGREKGQEGKPALLALRDLNGDGLPLETAFFEAEACMGLATTLAGYSPRRDRVMQYEVQLRVRQKKVVPGRGVVDAGEAATRTGYWIDYLFAKHPKRPGRWSFQIEYRGRGGTLDSYVVHYDPARERFFGTLSRLMPPGVDE
ncbi:MAG: hypothetical protein IPP47_14150 [Bryobacterales bacterium]|nr:hypothetical protein [Bryobacterales bacterium]